MTANGRLLDHPVPGSVMQPVPASLRLLRAGCMDFAALNSAPYWARKATRGFLGHCHGITTGTAEDAEHVVSELVTNAYLATGAPPGADYSRRAGTPAIRVSLRHFDIGLLIEVIDSSPVMPHPAVPSADADNGRGLIITAALSAGWGYFRIPGGKCVYCILRTNRVNTDSGPRQR